MTEEGTDRLDAIHRKLKAMLAKAESTSPEEAEALLAKAHEWMARYAIDEAVLAAADGSSAPAAVVERTWLVAGPYLARRMDLAVAVASSCGCRVVLGARVPAPRGEGGGQRQRLHVIGFEHDADWAEILHHGLLAQLDRAAAIAQAAKPAHIEGRSFASSFTYGWASRVGERLRVAAAEAKAAAEAAEAEEKAAARSGATGEAAAAAVFDLFDEPARPRVAGPGVALVLADKDKSIDDEVRRRFPKLVTVTRRATVGSGFGHGRAAGDRAVLSKGAAGQGQPAGALGRR